MRLLEIFAAMMGSATTVDAAAELGISQPAVSASLKQLEDLLGLVLFERTGRRLRPTPEAQALFDEIRPVFAMMRTVSQRARDMAQGKRGRLRIVSTPPLGYSVAPMALKHFLEARPDASVAYDVRRLSSVIEAVQSGQADVGLALAEDDHRGVVNLTPLRRTQMVALVPGDGPLALRGHVRARDLAGLPFIALELESHLGRKVKAAFEADEAPFSPRIEVRYCATAAALAGQGMGVTVVDPWSAAASRCDALVVRRFVPDTSVTACVITRRGMPQTGLVARYVDDLRAALEATRLPGT
ncbi:LysR family transcriptional regulator [Pseudooceanicola sediminis]|uniref:LysR family transcriptional regulator n=1 Tax=Pseudooceanicola sediminis TaxID=2211117 RepID=A0A399J630_9RHOB|nr:LysR family transcriptional regulator [Puniceibacterium sp. HSS470]RII39789.1 LysR family transcriptional regulator [Pseudooceanicola sediminis]